VKTGLSGAVPVEGMGFCELQEIPEQKPVKIDMPKYPNRPVPVFAKCSRLKTAPE
jgi:hypothetical protein